MLPEQKLALAVSGWLMGANDAVDNLQVAMSLVETRQLVLEYLNEPMRLQSRRNGCKGFGSQHRRSPKYVAAIAGPHEAADRHAAASKTPVRIESEIHGIENEPDVTYHVQLPPEYDPHVKYPTIVTLQGAGTTPEQQIDWWAGDRAARSTPAEKQPMRLPRKLSAAANAGNDKECNTSSGDDAPGLRADDDSGGPPIPESHDAAGAGDAARLYRHRSRAGPSRIRCNINTRPAKHAAVLDSLRDACRRFSIDTDRVYLSGHSMGGDAAWDIGLAHPDLWAGVIPIVATSGKYVAQYWPNAARLSFYFISGELDDNRTANKLRRLGSLLLPAAGWDMTLVEYQGRGHENFSDEVQRLFDWMGRKKRDFLPARNSPR